MTREGSSQYTGDVPEPDQNPTHSPVDGTDSHGASRIDTLDGAEDPHGTQDTEVPGDTTTPESKKKDPLGFLGLTGRTKTVVDWLSVAVAIWLLLNAVGAIGSGFSTAAGDQAEELFAFASNPFVGLAIGILATVILQSSSTTTSITVGMAAGGLPIEVAIPILFGANIGTTVTSTLVALGLSGNKAQFRRAFAMATVHDFYNLLSLAIFFPLELTTNFLERISGWAAQQVTGEGDNPVSAVFEAIGSVVTYLTEPGVMVLEWVVSPLGDVWGGIALAVIGVVLILLVIGFIGSKLSSLMVGRAQEMLHTTLGRGPFTGVLSGTVITMIVQSSSTTTALTVPLAASGKFRMRELFPFVVGANIGTTTTGLIAAFSATGVEATVAMQAALVHAMYNVAAAILIMSVPFLRAIPPACADWLAGLAEKNKIYVVLWIGGVFIALPLLAIFLTNTFF